ncbi:AAA family ATPase [Lentzea tibetensis]|uniref:AAA family ATPase n=1 Tax=Lentzea tibetensis TaxID=2591470 RepID=A0A563EV27_9PSEU|nr:ATP-binding protein [Lentzea tibetensis]TWP51519.1 AAA family ATPase [Lentzea tibetensis]
MDAIELGLLVADLRTEGSDLAEVEVKRAAGGFPENLAPTLSAFGNTPGGGLIIFGLDEHSGFEARGVYDVAACQQAIAAAARNAVTPPLTIATTSVTFEDAQIVVAEVGELPSTSKPCRARSTNRAYLRSYDGDYPISELEEQAFLASRETPRFDQQEVPEASIHDLDDDLVNSYVSSCHSTSTALQRFPHDELLFRTGVLVGNARRPSIAGLLALGAYPQQFFPNLVIQASVSPSSQDPAGTRAVDARRFDGPIPVMLDEALRWVNRNTRSRIRFGRDGHGRDEPEYPAEAVRELLSNALVHRDLGPHALGEAITLRLDNSQLVLSNPGGLWGLTTARLGQTGVTSARNGFLVRICQNVRYSGDQRVVEALATGIPTVLRAVQEAGMVPPRFHDQGIRFAVLMPNHALLAEDDLHWLSTTTDGILLSDVQRHVLVAMRHGETWTNKTLRDAFPMDSRDATRTFAGLVDAGLAQARGERGGRVYELAEDLDDNIVEPPINLIDEEYLPETTSAILDALRDNPSTISEIMDVTGLTYRQVQYALASMREAGRVVLEGGRGRRDSRYSLA